MNEKNNNKRLKYVLVPINIVNFGFDPSLIFFFEFGPSFSKSFGFSPCR